MSKKIGLLFSGQGAQVVGMGKDLREHSPAAEKVFAQANQVLGRDLTQVMFEGPDTELTRTANCQPALYVHGLACLAALQEQQPLEPAAVAGLSLGEFTAHAAAGTFSFADGLKLVERRGQLMAQACQSTEGGMAAMIGADEATVAQLAQAFDIDIANLNAPGQIVVSGKAENVKQAVAAAKEHGVRIAKQLHVAGAYHSRLMQLAYDEFAAALDATPIQSPEIPVMSNFFGTPSTDPNTIRSALHQQITGTVRWTSDVEFMMDSIGCETFIELGPGGVLAGLMNRIRKGTNVISIATHAELQQFHVEP